MNRYLRILILHLGIIFTLCGWLLLQHVQSPPHLADPKPSAPLLTPQPQAGLPFAVYITGAVIKPGLYEAKEGMRVLDIVNLAGGLQSGGAGDTVNMAQLVKDGQHIVIPASNAIKSSTSPSVSRAGKKININTADKNELDQLPGIGPAIAEKLIEHRTSKGPFRDLGELQDVSGIGEAKYRQLAPHITL